MHTFLLSMKIVDMKQMDLAVWNQFGVLRGNERGFYFITEGKMLKTSLSRRGTYIA